LKNSIVTLGPQGTYSEIATKQYLSKNDLDLEIIYASTIGKALQSIGKTAAIGMLPIENFSEGFVNLVLDHLVNSQLYIWAETLLPIRFSLVSNCEKIEDIEKVYVQFVAKGQCADYLESMQDTSFISTESNTQSLSLMLENASAAAVVPSHLLANNNFNYVVENVTDYKNNQTRFLLFSDCMSEMSNSVSESYKTSIIVLFHDDYPGYLETILRCFTMRSINLTSIVSRPTRRTFGKYHFFIDLDGHMQDLNVSEALDEIQKRFKVKVLGSYPKSNNQSVENTR
jgi:prephenate dehydratase